MAFGQSSPEVGWLVLDDFVENQKQRGFTTKKEGDAQTYIFTPEN